jgi:hypothetical protein
MTVYGLFHFVRWVVNLMKYENWVAVVNDDTTKLYRVVLANSSQDIGSPCSRVEAVEKLSP